MRGDFWILRHSTNAIRILDDLCGREGLSWGHTLPISIFDVYQLMGDNWSMSVDPKTIALDDAQRKILAEVSDKWGRPWPEVFTNALSEYRPKPHQNGHNVESFGAAAERLGYMGSVEGPADLSTNPAYMEGFGQREK